MDFDELEDIEIAKCPGGVIARMKEWEMSGEWREPDLGAQTSKPVQALRSRGDRPSRIMLLHGTGGSEKIFSTQAQKILKAGEKRNVEFIMAEGPQECTHREAVETLEQFFPPSVAKKQYAELEIDSRTWRRYKSIDRALEWLQQQLKKHHPIDGVLGFSQGANFAAMLAAQAFRGAGAPLSCVCLLSPNPPGYIDQLPGLFDEPIRVPALIVRGEKESYEDGIKKAMKGMKVDKQGEAMPSAHVAKLFADAETLTHTGGHAPYNTSSPQETDALVGKVISFLVDKSALAPQVRPGDGSAARSQGKEVDEKGAADELAGREKQDQAEKEKKEGADQEAQARREREEQEAKERKEKEEREATEQKEREEREARAKKEADEREAKEKEEQEAQARKEREEQEAREKKENDERKAKERKEREEQEKREREKEQQEAEARKEREERERKTRAEQEERTRKEREEQEERARQEREAQEKARAAEEEKANAMAFAELHAKLREKDERIAALVRAQAEKDAVIVDLQKELAVFRQTIDTIQDALALHSKSCGHP